MPPEEALTICKVPNADQRQSLGRLIALASDRRDPLGLRPTTLYYVAILKRCFPDGLQPVPPPPYSTIVYPPLRQARGFIAAHTGDPSTPNG